jgi:hypothetical protein
LPFGGTFRCATKIELGRDVLEEGDTWSIVIPPEDNKTGIHIEFEMPELLRKPFLV